MGRNATLHIKNETGHDLAYTDHKIEHGKFQKGHSPPKEIASGGTGTFEVGNHTGAKIGPKGWVEYSLGYARGITVRLRFFWDHPFSHHTSTYEVGSYPPWFGAYYLDPPNPTGHNQEVTYVTRLNDYGFDPKQWMASAATPATLVRDLFIPGSHDSGSYDIKYMSNLTIDIESAWIELAAAFNIAQGWSRAQVNSIASQLDAGIRYFDLRVSNAAFVTSVVGGAKIHYIGPKDPIPTDPEGHPLSNVARRGMKICHSLTSVSPSKVISDVAGFLGGRPKEIVVLNFQHFYGMGTEDYGMLLKEIDDKLGSKLLGRGGKDFSALSLGDLWKAGKQAIVCFGKDHVVTHTSKPGENTKPFSDRYKALCDAHAEIWPSQDWLFDPWPNKQRAADLKAALNGDIADARGKRKQLFVLQGIVTPDEAMYKNSLTGKYPKSLEELAKDITPQVTSWVNNDWFDKGVNIVMLDWTATSVVTQICYMLNKHYKDQGGSKTPH